MVTPSDEQLVDRLVTAQARVRAAASVAVERFATHGDAMATLKSASSRLVGAEGSLHNALASLRDAVTGTRADLLEALEQTRGRVESSKPRVAALQTALSGDDLRAAFSDLLQDIPAQLETLSDAAGVASSAIEAVSSGLETGTEQTIDAVAQILGAIEKDSESSRARVEQLLASVAGTLDQLQASFDQSSNTLGQGRSTFESFLTSTLESAIRGPSDAMGETSRTFAESDLRAKASEAVRAVVDALIDAARSLRDNGEDMRGHREEAASKFDRMGSGVSRTEAKTGHVHAEHERLQRERDESGEEDV